MLFAFLARGEEGEEDADDDDDDEDDDDSDSNFVFVAVDRKAASAEAYGGASSDLLRRLFASRVVAAAGALRFLPMVGHKT